MDYINTIKTELAHLQAKSEEMNTAQTSDDVWPGNPNFQEYTNAKARQSAEKMAGKDFQTNGSPTLINGTSRNNMLRASFSVGVHSLALNAGIVNIQIDHILY